MKRVLITGANRGLGLGFARQYLEKGNEVYACTRSPSMAKDLVSLAEMTNKLHIIQMDVSSEDSIAKAAASIDMPIDLLINNAGVIGDREEDLNGFSTDTLLDTFRTNAIGPLLVLSSLREHLAKGEGKQAVTISSRMGSISDNASGGYHSYRASKSALNALMRSAALELEFDKVHMLVLHPGWVRTDMGGKNATISIDESVANMIKIIDNYKIYPTGSFVSHTSELIPW